MPKPALLYVHIPFCIHHCRTCTACVLIGDKSVKREYLDALETEIIASAPALSGYSFPAVYVGGGSPTTMEPDALAKLIRKIRTVLPVEARAEITVETMPQTVCTPSLGGLKAGGVNRISLSMQSAVQNELEALDCGFSLWDVENSVLFLDRFHFNNVNIDLMYGIPGQTVHTLKNTLRFVRGFSPTHISLYPFPGKPLQDKPSRENDEGVSVDDACSKDSLLSYAVECLAEYGYERYSTFHCAQRGRECMYWKARYEGMEYVGLGLGARSLIDGFTYTNTTDWEVYRSHSAEFEALVTDVAQLTAEEMKHYRIACNDLLKPYSVAERF